MLQSLAVAGNFQHRHYGNYGHILLLLLLFKSIAAICFTSERIFTCDRDLHGRDCGQAAATHPQIEHAITVLASLRFIYYIRLQEYVYKSVMTYTGGHKS